MPAGDGTGPFGMGPMTGRAAGFCAGYPAPGYMNPWQRAGLGRGFWGRGRGWRHWYWATGLPGWVRAAYGMPAWGCVPFVGPVAPSPAVEADALKRHAEFLERQLEDIRRRLSELEAEQADKAQK